MNTQNSKTVRHSIKHTSRLKGLCPSGKIRYRDRRMAVDALHHAQNVGALALELTGATSRNETRIYACPDCAGFHLTSRPTWANVKQAA